MRYTGSSNRLRRKLDLLSDSQSLESRGRLGGRPGDAKRRPQTRVQIDVDVAGCPISRRRPPPVPPQCGPGFRERGRAPPHVCQSLKDHRGRAVRQTLARGRRPSQTRDAAAGDLARDPLPSCRHSQSKEHEQRGRRTTRGRCQDAHGSRGSGCRTEYPTSARGGRAEQTKTQEQVEFTEVKPALVNTIRQQPARVVTHGVHGDA